MKELNSRFNKDNEKIQELSYQNSQLSEYFFKIDPLKPRVYYMYNYSTQGFRKILS